MVGSSVFLLERRITASHCPVECCALPQTGGIVEIPGDIPIRGVLVERGSLCRIAIGFDAMGRTVGLRIPLDDLKRLARPSHTPPADVAQALVPAASALLPTLPSTQCHSRAHMSR